MQCYSVNATVREEETMTEYGVTFITLDALDVFECVNKALEEEGVFGEFFLVQMSVRLTDIPDWVEPKPLVLKACWFFKN